MTGEKQWVVAYCLPIASWTSGGSLDEYSQDNHDVFRVLADYRETAEERARTLRRKCMRISGSTRLLIDGLLVDCGGADTGEVFDIQPHEDAAARRLEKIGLLEFVGDGPSSRCVRLTHMAFNPCMAPEMVRAARVSQHRLENKTPEAGRALASKPRL